MNRFPRCSLAAAAALSTLVLAACATNQNADGAKGQLETLPLPVELVLMPIGDERAERFENVEISRYVRDAAVRVLAGKGYAAVPRDDVASRGLAAPRDVDKMTGAELAALAPSGASTLLFLTLTRVERGYTYGGDDYAITLSGVVVDAVTKKILWRGIGSGRTSLGGFFRVLSPSSPGYDAVYGALRNLFRTVPKRRE